MLRRSITSLMAIGAVSVLLALAPPKAFALPTLQIENGILMGATGVDVDGTFYNVEFLVGTCIALFNGCDDSTDFPFQTQAQATAANQALLDQVLLDSPLGTFDTDPEKTYGCQSRENCVIWTPLALAYYWEY